MSMLCSLDNVSALVGSILTTTGCSTARLQITTRELLKSHTGYFLFVDHLQNLINKTTNIEVEEDKVAEFRRTKGPRNTESIQMAGRRRRLNTSADRMTNMITTKQNKTLEVTWSCCEAVWAVRELTVAHTLGSRSPFLFFCGSSSYFVLSAAPRKLSYHIYPAGWLHYCNNNYIELNSALV